MPSSLAPQAAPVPVGWARVIPGLLASAAAVVLAAVIHLVVPAIPLLTVSVVLGIAAGQLRRARPLIDGRLRPGLTLAARRLMRVGIVLLGLKLSLGDIAELGWLTVLLVVLIVLLTFAFTLTLGRLAGLPGREPLLLAAGFSICGASAIGAMAAATGSPVRDQARPIALVTLCGTLAIAVLPLLRIPIGLDTIEYGQWVGASVHDVGQVVATAQVAGPAALAVAVVVKLTRVLMLAPMVTLASVLTRAGVERVRRRADAGAGDRAGAGDGDADGVGDGAGDGAEAGAGDGAGTGAGTGAGAGAGVNTVASATDAGRNLGQRADAASEVSRGGIRSVPLVPLFVAGFLAAVLVRSFVPLPDAVLAGADVAQTILLAMALFAIGTAVRLRTLFGGGGRSIAVALASWAAIAAMALLAVRL